MAYGQNASSYDALSLQLMWLHMKIALQAETLQLTLT